MNQPQKRAPIPCWGPRRAPCPTLHLRALFPALTSRCPLGKGGQWLLCQTPFKRPLLTSLYKLVDNSSTASQGTGSLSSLELCLL